MTENTKTYYKYCIVPLCTNTTSSCSEKLFFSVPKDPVIRKAWTNAMKRDDKRNPMLSNTSSLWCCQDHFSLKDDMENYCQWMLTRNVKRLKLKPGTIPHRFDCQKKHIPSPIERKGTKKRKHLSLIEEALSSPVSLPSTSTCNSLVEPLGVEVCELHFEPDQILREASARDSRTGRTLTAPLAVPRLRKGAVPTLLLPPARRHFKPRKDPKRKIQPSENTVKEGTEKKDGIGLANWLQTDLGSESQKLVETSTVIKQEQVESMDAHDLGTESQSVVETSTVIKQEPFESTDEHRLLVIKEIFSAEELALISNNSSSIGSSSSTNNSSSSNSLSLPGNASPTVGPDSAKADETPHVLNKQKRKMNDTEPDASDTMPNATEAKFPPAGTSKKFGGPFTSPTKKGKILITKIVQSLVDSPENNPMIGSRSSERPGDLFDVFADFIADKLRQMDWDDCAYALRAILEIVFKACKVNQDCEVASDNSSHGTSSRSTHQE